MMLNQLDTIIKKLQTAHAGAEIRTRAAACCQCWTSCWLATWLSTSSHREDGWQSSVHLKKLSQLTSHIHIHVSFTHFSSLATATRTSWVLQQLQGQAESCNSYKDKLSLATATRRSTHHVALITTVWSHNCFCGFNSMCLTHCLLDLWWRILKHECEKTVCKVQLQEDCTVHISTGFSHFWQVLLKVRLQ